MSDAGPGAEFPTEEGAAHTGADRIVLSERRLYRAIVLFPFAIDRAHTVAYSGGHWVRNIKAGFKFTRLTLTDTALTARWLWTNVLIFRVARSDILSASPVEGMPGLVQVEFADAEFGRMSGFFLSGGPPARRDTAILNVRDPHAWHEALSPDGS